ncbi:MULTISPECIES: YceI family protein [Helicobacter]|uniref:YceI family protein n=1 Tax=Helicobacter TaxID=209 RepID=UPI000EB5B673|nr:MULTISPECIES: YceI family protein [Helicobacter]
MLLRPLMVLCVLSALLMGKTYQIDKAHSRVGFKIKHLKISYVMGDFKDYSALIDFDPASHIFKKLEATIKATSVDTNNKNRDDHLRSDDFFKTGTHPNITFVMQKYEKVDKEKGRVVGVLNIAGVAKKVVLKSQIGGVAKINGTEKLGFSLSGQIKRSDFKFAPDMSTLKIGDVVTLNIEVEAAQK